MLMDEKDPAFGPDERLRRDARSLAEAALVSVDPATLVEEAIYARPLDAGEQGSIIVLAVGKAARGMAEGAHRALGRRIAHGVVLAPSGSSGPVPKGFEMHRGSHPLPDADGMAGARAIAETARRAGPHDRLLVLLSGGGSALLTLPDGDVSLEDLREVTRLLLLSGAPIAELNAVRKHLDQLKGGGLARIAMPARVRALLLSDVVGDPPDVIASGPVSPDPTTFADAIEVLERRGLWDQVPASVREHLVFGREGQIPETPKPGDPPFVGVQATVIGNAARAVAGAAFRARALGYDVHVHSVELAGEAREVGRELARLGRQIRDGSGPVAPPAVLLAGGETTVVVTGDGKGGRNQEVALAAALELDGIDRVLVLSLATDGVDGPTDAAGAVAVGATLRRARHLGLDARASLERNDTYRFFQQLDDLVTTGPTGTNVMDLMIVLVGE
jgi:hydroxypyruvate reductase